MHEWLSYGSPDASVSVFSRREWSFTVQTEMGEEIYLRYQSFGSALELRDAVVKRRPIKIDIGGAYNHPPKDRKAYTAAAFRPTERELVFDIDLTDYDDVRTCCSEANICHKCWILMACAIEVIDACLKEDFGFKQLHWFYSGRRGVHCWVVDDVARELTDEARGAIVQYFLLDFASEKSQKGTGNKLPIPLHPMLKRSYDILEPYFIEHVLSESGLLGLLANKKSWLGLLNNLPRPANKVAADLMEKWNKHERSPVEKWTDLTSALDSLLEKRGGRSSKTPKHNNMSFSERQEIESWKFATVFRHTYPRLDAGVSKARNHLLKAPFCVHPKTGRVCVPIAPDKVREFDPFAVPTVGELVRELDMTTKGGDEGIADWERTSLKKCFQAFKEGFLTPLKRECAKKKGCC
mmetsp:Transcript_33697/g.77765  ORF Transcript_33697/g.77765 Transcript_33697/m.77765 type:complete len:408 (+) Transcript_33697:620-1843(+)